MYTNNYVEHFYRYPAWCAGMGYYNNARNESCKCCPFCGCRYIRMPPLMQTFYQEAEPTGGNVPSAAAWRCLEKNTHAESPHWAGGALYDGEDDLCTDLPFVPDEMDDCSGKGGSVTNRHRLLHFRKWWEQTEVDISVCGKLVTGTPIFIEEDTLRVINKNHSYFIPLDKVDYIRTSDGLCSCYNLPDDQEAQ